MACPTILLADDDGRLTLSLKFYLESMGYEVHRADNGRDAFQVARATPPDLLVINTHLPGCDGLSVIELMDQEKHLQTIPVIYITDHDQDPALHAACEQSGAMAVISKPVDAQELMRSIQQTLPLARLDPNHGSDSG